MDSPFLGTFLLPLLIALFGAIPSTYLLYREWKKSQRQDIIAEMTLAGEITDAAATLIKQLREECVVLRSRLAVIEGSSAALIIEVKRLSAETIRQAGVIDSQGASLREQERIIAQQEARIADLEEENARLRRYNESLVQRQEETKP